MLRRHTPKIYVKREIDEGLLTGLYIPSDDALVVGDAVYEDIGKLYGLDGYIDNAWNKKIYDVLTLIGGGNSFMGQSPIESYLCSEELTSDDIKFDNAYSLSDFKDFSLSSYATDDYKVEMSDKVSMEEYMVEWQVYSDEGIASSVPVRYTGAYSYTGTTVYSFNENGQVIERQHKPTACPKPPGKRKIPPQQIQWVFQKNTTEFMTTATTPSKSLLTA